MSHDYGLKCERCGAWMDLHESAMGGLCHKCRDTVVEELAMMDDEKRPPERGNVRRYNDNPATGMVADDLGRWVSFAQYRAHVFWLAKRLEEATGINKGAWLEKMRQEACGDGSADA